MFCFYGENLSQRLLMRRFFALCTRGKDTTQTDSLHLVYLENVMFRDAYYLYPRVVGGGWRIFFFGGGGGHMGFQRVRPKDGRS